MQVGFSPDPYRDHCVALRKKKDQSTPHCTSKPGFTPVSRNNMFDDNPPIDYVCKRLIVKWEPTFNIVHRYLFCRCIIRLSTPSRIEKELTLLRFAYCPRHNVRDIHYLDYGDIDYNEDEYFDKFGGYLSFQGMICYYLPNVYNTLGGGRFIPKKQVQAALNASDAFREADEAHLKEMLQEYIFEVNDELDRAGVTLPDTVLLATKAARSQRAHAQAAKNRKLGLSGSIHAPQPNEEQQEQLQESPMMQEVEQILNGEWSGKPHWTIED